jgi:hypothetical protein
MVSVICKHSGLTFEAETKRTKVHPMVALYWSNKDDLKRKIAYRVLRERVESIEEFVEKFDREYKLETTPEVSEDKAVEPADEVILKISRSTKLSGLGKSIAELSGKGEWTHWELKYWDKNGECRIYLVDKSYVNNKDRGYLTISANSTYTHRDPLHFPGLPKLPSVEPDLAKLDLSPEAKAIRRLDVKFGEGKWNQLDFEDEVENYQ